MRTAIVSSGLGHVQRGIEAWAKTLAENLAADGEEVHLFHGGGAYACPETHLRFHRRGDPWVRVVTRVSPRPLWRWGLTSPYAFEQRSCAAALLPHLKRSGFDVVHTQDVILAAILEREGQAGHLDCPVILAHGTDESLACLKGFRYLQHLSPAHRDIAVKELGGLIVDGGNDLLPGRQQPSHLHFCVPNFVDIGRFTPGSGGVERAAAPAPFRRELGIPDDALVVGCAAALKCSHKRLDVLIREVTALPQAPACPGGEGKAQAYLLLAGAVTDETEQLRSLAKERLGTRCVLLENLPFARMPDFYRALDLFVLPALEEVFGICFLESMACGIPVVAHSSPTLQWVVGAKHDDAPGGWCVDMREAGFLARLWPRLQRDMAEKRRTCRDHVVAEFSWQAVRSLFLSMYDVVSRDWKARNASEHTADREERA